MENSEIENEIDTVSKVDKDRTVLFQGKITDRF